MADERTQQTQRVVAQRLKYSRNLPTLPSVALKLIDLANDTSANLDDFAQLITNDPALASKLLRVANSSFYGRRRSVATLSQALNLLGLNATVTLALGFSLRSSFASNDSGTLDANHYWRACLLNAVASRALAVEMAEARPEIFFLSALLREIGVLVMETTLGDDYAVLYAGSENHEDLLAREVTAFGFNHADAGNWLLAEWGLPASLCSSIQLSHDASVFDRPGESEDIRLGAFAAAGADIAQVWLAGGEPNEFSAIEAELGGKLSLDSAGYQNLIAAMAEQIPDVEAIFDVHLVDQKLLAEAEYSAREILISRNLRMLQTAVDSERETRALERRTTALEEQARRDAMTGLFNRHYLERVLEQEFMRARCDSSPLTVAFIDIDHFKQINDTYGHAMGDQVIIGVARRLLCQVRQTDIVARYGGEEFVVVLMGASSADIGVIMDRILKVIRDSPFRVDDADPVSVSVSAGVATHLEDECPFTSAALLLEAADVALYQAKRSGRGQVVTYKPGAQ